ncbi:MAG: hypothetical protein M1837_002980 [Sclerophora amabilis]|nr:MAG: hypothetical protein M1837_002980 [Sclerophora amabilis]
MASKITGYVGEDVWRLCEPANVLEMPVELGSLGSDGLRHTFDVQVLPVVYAAFKDNGMVKPKQVFYSNLRGQYRRTAKWHPTIEIDADRQSMDGWPKVMETVRAFLTEIDRPDIVVDIRDNVYLRRKTFAVDKSDSICEKWPEIRPKVRKLLEKLDYNALEVFRRGIFSFPITILITAGKGGTAEEWQELAEAVHEICIQAQLEDVDVEVYRDEIILYSDLVDLGANIGYKDDSYGTLGGYISLDTDTGKKIYGLTCAHMVGDDGGIPNGEIVPIGPETGGAPRDPIPLDSPSKRNHQELLKEMKADIVEKQGRIEILEKLERRSDASGNWFSEGARENLNERRSQKTSKEVEYENFKKRDLSYGNIFWAPEIHRSKSHGCVIDWALIEVQPDREGTNRLPPREAIDSDVRKRYEPTGETIPKRGSFVLDEMYFKSGANTKVTMGRCNGIFSEAKAYPHLGETKEMSIVRCKKYPIFASPGDSGAFVVDKEGNLCGMITSGSLDESRCYVTPIEVVFADISKKTGMKASLPDEREY